MPSSLIELLRWQHWGQTSGLCCPPHLATEIAPEAAPQGVSQVDEKNGKPQLPPFPTVKTTSALGCQNTGEREGRAGEPNPILVLPQRVASASSFLLSPPPQCEADDWATRYVNTAVAKAGAGGGQEGIALGSQLCVGTEGLGTVFCHRPPPPRVYGERVRLLHREILNFPS